MVCGHRGRESSHSVHHSTILKQSSLRLILTLASIFGFYLYSIEVTQASLQSAAALHQNIFIKPDVIELNPEELLQLTKPIYGLTESGDYWDETLLKQQIEDLGMNATTGDHSLFFTRLSNRLVG